MTDSTPEVIPVLENIKGIRAFFTTRRGGVSTGTFESLNLSYFSGDSADKVRENWDRLLRSQNLDAKIPALPRLCHGSRVEEVFATDSAPLENTDAIYTLSDKRLLAVTLGDCLAALIVDPEKRCVATVHAGWRGSRENILGKTLTHLFEGGRCSPDSTWIAFGPCLATESLEISGEIAATLPERHVKNLSGRFFFDLRGCNRAQAEALGVPPLQISEIPDCTRKNPDRFFSYRRDGAASGRMAACITLI